ncbi:hypothetical protein FIU82_01770 [Pseudoalteromonas sp. THAF3]|uniref:hypothetical protein n=1 Tax=unclassified Pseudoalteromonas TaxID=194690 RepID=UPI001267D788|nr:MULTISPECIES: hypothetical protein [unclassified Pseudoalteromonas]MCG7566565.1 hypothetical protein [Pseudoalteromonas sp. CnMc7-15]QFU03745.1 hypothetical protein FIU82_01770 [Pseudoalteromonas sp. THAF3]
MEFTHIGWIPCINGHLDYGLMAPGISGSFTTKKLRDNKTTRVNFGHRKQYDHHSRRIILQSKLDWKDTNTPDFDGEFRIVVVGETNESENLDNRILSGKLFIYPLSEEPELTSEGKSELPWFEHIHQAKSFQDKINSKLSSEAWEKLQQQLNTHFLGVKSSLESDFKKHISSHFYEICFQVDPHGFTKLKLTNSSTTLSDEKKYLTLRQAFYYIKYSLHSHKHHYIEEDSLTTIVPLGNSTSSHKRQVALKLLGQLKRELTSIKRTYSSGGQKAFGEEQGIISYMNSLCASLKSARYIDESTYTREKEYLNSLSSSFSVQSGKREKKDRSEGDIRSKYRVYVAWVLSLISIIWLVIVKGFINYSDTNKIDAPGGLITQLSAVILTLICGSFLYKKLVDREIENTLNTEGLIAWVERNYIIENQVFRKKQYIRILKAALTLILTVGVIWGLHATISF